MDPAPIPSGPARDRWIALAAVGLACLMAAGWITRERQLATDLAESREDLRQAMHRLRTLTASTDQIRTAYLQRRTELEAARKKIDQLAQRQEEKKRETAAGEKKSDTKPEASAALSALAEKVIALKLPAWAAVQKSEGAVRILPGASLPSGNEGLATFGSIARILAEADPEMIMELKARAEPGDDALDTAKDRAKRLAASAERSLKGDAARVRIVSEIAKGPRMEWRLTPASPPAPKAQPAKP